MQNPEFMIIFCSLPGDAARPPIGELLLDQLWLRTQQGTRLNPPETGR